MPTAVYVSGGRHIAEEGHYGYCLYGMWLSKYYALCDHIWKLCLMHVCSVCVAGFCKYDFDVRLGF